MANTLRPDDFRGLDQPLRIELRASENTATIELAVESVVDLPSHRLREAPFSLVLRGSRAPLLPQATYAVVHPRLGPIDIFLVPIGQDAQGTRYEATFN